MWALPQTNGAHRDGPYCLHWWLLDHVLRQFAFHPDDELKKALAAARDAWWEKHMRPQPNLDELKV